jgi:hypothetical protein
MTPVMSRQVELSCPTHRFPPQGISLIGTLMPAFTDAFAKLSTFLSAMKAVTASGGENIHNHGFHTLSCCFDADVKHMGGRNNDSERQ